MTDPTALEPKDDRPVAPPGLAAHVVPVPVLLGVFAALMVFTYLTVAAAGVDLGDWNLPIAIGIATLKASLVALYFMHLRYDNPFYALIFLVGLWFVALFISLTLLDTLEYQPDTNPWAEESVALR